MTIMIPTRVPDTHCKFRARLHAWGNGRRAHCCMLTASRGSWEDAIRCERPSAGLASAFPKHSLARLPRRCQLSVRDSRRRMTLLVPPHPSSRDPQSLEFPSRFSIRDYRQTLLVHLPNGVAWRLSLSERDHGLTYFHATPASICSDARPSD